MSDQVVSNNSASIEIVKKLKNKIFSGELKNNDRLVETAIAQENNVNKIHVHKALQQLSAEGLLEYKPRRGFFVLGVDESDFLELVKIREVMENAIMEKFITVADKKIIDSCIRIIKRKLAFLNSGLIDDADLETIKFFKEVNKCVNYKHIPRLLKQHQSYLMNIVHSDFKVREDLKITIETTKVLLDALENVDINKASLWVSMRHDNLVKSCHTNANHLPKNIGPKINNEYDF
ncbi:MAG: GntR family transcriptional regulator [Pleomorphochaeta sp.]